jgi:hypothetical protein
MQHDTISTPIMAIPSVNEFGSEICVNIQMMTPLIGDLLGKLQLLLVEATHWGVW